MLTLPNATKLDKGITFYAISVAYFELLLQIEDCYNKNIEKRVVDAGWFRKAGDRDDVSSCLSGGGQRGYGAGWYRRLHARIIGCPFAG